ncbi:unnamed protein product [Ixodes persulcatus]
MLDIWIVHTLPFLEAKGGAFKERALTSIVPKALRFLTDSDWANKPLDVRSKLTSGDGPLLGFTGQVTTGALAVATGAMGHTSHPVTPATPTTCAPTTTPAT